MTQGAGGLNRGVDLAVEARETSKVAWYAVKARPRHERVVARGLEERGVRCFLPLWRRLRRWSDRLKVVETPLFPTYLFVEIAPRQRLDVVRVRGAIDLVGGREPVAVDPEEIDALLRLAAGGAVLEPHVFLREGQRARVSSGPFRGVEGFLVERRPRSKLVVSVTLFSQSVALTLDAGDVEPA